MYTINLEFMGYVQAIFISFQEIRAKILRNCSKTYHWEPKNTKILHQNGKFWSILLSKNKADTEKMASFIKFVHGLYMSDFSCTNVHTSTNVQVQMHVYTCYQYGRGAPSTGILALPHQKFANFWSILVKKEQNYKIF